MRPQRKERPKTLSPRPFGLIGASTLTIAGGSAGVSVGFGGNYGVNTGPTLFFRTLFFSVRVASNCWIFGCFLSNIELSICPYFLISILGNTLARYLKT